MVMQSDQLRETTPHGNSMFPIAVHKIPSNTLIASRVDLHWHEESEILMVITGHGELRIDDRTFFIKENDIIFIDAECLHSITCQPGEVFLYYAIMFKQHLLYSMMNDRIQQKYFEPVLKRELVFPNLTDPCSSWGQEIQDRIIHIYQVYQLREEGFELIIKSDLLIIWRLLYLHAEENTEKKQKIRDARMESAKEILKYIEKNYAEKISVSSMAGIFHMSESYLCHFFKSITNMTIIEYVNRVRINKSADLLRNSAMGIGEIAVAVGFNNISYFNKTFLSYMFVTPSEYRRQDFPDYTP